MWAQRTSMYASQSRTGGASRPSTAPAATDRTRQQRPISAGSLNFAAFPEGSSRSSSSRNTGVPKTLGVASCAGCGCRSFFNADGRTLKPCAACRQVYYCSETCAKFDQPSHKALCRYYVTGHWTPAGTRPAADCWVVNRSMAVARKLLKQHHDSRASAAAVPAQPLYTAQQLDLQGQKMTSSPHNNLYYCIDARVSTQAADVQSFEQLEQGQQYDSRWNQELAWQEQLAQQLAAVQLQEQQQEAAQRLLEQRAAEGLDGPRPCLSVNGMEFVGGRKFRPKSSQVVRAPRA